MCSALVCCASASVLPSFRLCFAMHPPPLRRVSSTASPVSAQSLFRHVFEFLFNLCSAVVQSFVQPSSSRVEVQTPSPSSVKFQKYENLL
ncbi:uncharacterized protein DS421_4g124910 [Arachis hypogaea]|nr:uncharacterized protein DS421_4g124910 [Arachis hypogaea]